MPKRRLQQQQREQQLTSTSNEQRETNDTTTNKRSNTILYTTAETSTVSPTTFKRLNADWFDQNVLELSKALLGKYIVRKISQQRLVARIVETEAYPGGDDVASHSHNNKRTARNAAMFMCPGTAYVYNIYGTMQCINISAKWDGAAVLIRAAEPIEGLELMRTHRSSASKSKTTFTNKQLCNGPSKLCQALAITKLEFDQTNLSDCESLYIASDNSNCSTIEENDIHSCARIGIDNYGKPWSTLPYRFYVKNNGYVSKK